VTSINSFEECKQLYNNPIASESEGILFRSRLQSTARRMGFSEGRRQNMALVAAELVTNQVKHARSRGMLQIWQQPGPALDLVALDFGPGIPNLVLAQQDGYSTANTLGKGLGSIRRLSDESAVYSVQPKDDKEGKWHGSLFWTRFWLNGRSGVKKDAEIPGVFGEKVRLGLFARALGEDRYNGDRIYMLQDKDRLRWLHLDGLGHGQFAHEAVENLAGCLVRGDNAGAVLMQADRQLASTRGAVAISCAVDIANKSVELMGVGDMGAHFYTAEKLQNLTFAPGVLGKEHKTPQSNKLTFEKRCTIVTASDGIRRSWKFESFLGLFNQHPQVIAYLLGNIMGRASDDQSLCVVKIG
jgi:anti-sigma regulatory factor (Ser/Thr protein kinase)